MVKIKMFILDKSKGYVVIISICKNRFDTRKNKN